MGLQIAIVVLGRGKLDIYVNCLEESLEVMFNSSLEIPSNLTLPVLTKLHTLHSDTDHVLSISNYHSISFLFRHLETTRKYMHFSSLLWFYIIFSWLYMQ